MAIRIEKGGEAKHNIIFPDHQMAHYLLDGLRGLELGAAAHNPFNLAGSINVAPVDDDEGTYRPAQIDMCGFYALIDVKAEAHDLPFGDDSQDYIISSHVFEHLPNPITALREWQRVIKDGGYVFMIVPLPDALPDDIGRPLATRDELIWTLNGITVDNWDYKAKPISGERRGHYFVYDAPTLAEHIAYFFPQWELVDREDKDSKVGNGFTLIYRIYKPALKTCKTEVINPAISLSLQDLSHFTADIFNS